MYTCTENASYYTPSCDISWKFLGEIAVGLALTPLSTIIHEYGHALAAYLLYNDAKPRITLDNYGYKGGVCIYYNSTLSKLGKRVGSDNTQALIAFAGPATTMITAIALLRLIPGNGYIHTQVFSNTTYALSTLVQDAFWTEKITAFEPRHDFLDIKILKGTFAASTLIIISVALGIFSMYSIFSNVMICTPYDLLTLS
jgi:hypothetical protein